MRSHRAEQPDRIGSYEILEPLGQGGMAQLFVARPLSGPARKVALKVVHRHLSAHQRFIDMFRDEARVLSLVDHPNVVSAREHGEADGRSYIVMDYIDGDPLGSIMERASLAGQTLPVAAAVRIAGKILDGLGAAHELRDERGRCLDVVHRDVSPQNVLIGHDGRIRVIDFGIAKSRGRLHQTQNNNVKGKLRYMAPEHCGGETVDRRTDIYSTAIVLWEMLAMRPYFDGRNELDLVRQVRRPVYRSSIPWNGRVAPALDGALRRALHPNPARRFQTARAFRNALLAACPSSRDVGPAHVAAFISSLGSPAKPVRSVDPLAATAAGAGRRAAQRYTFHVVVPKGAGCERSPKTKLLGPAARRRVAPPGSASRRRGASRFSAWFAAAALLMCFIGGGAGVALGHAIAAITPTGGTTGTERPATVGAVLRSQERGGRLAVNESASAAARRAPIVVRFPQ